MADTTIALVVLSVGSILVSFVGALSCVHRCKFANCVIDTYAPDISRSNSVTSPVINVARPNAILT